MTGKHANACMQAKTPRARSISSFLLGSRAHRHGWMSAMSLERCHDESCNRLITKRYSPVQQIFGLKFVQIGGCRSPWNRYPKTSRNVDLFALLQVERCFQAVVRLEAGTQCTLFLLMSIGSGKIRRRYTGKHT